MKEEIKKQIKVYPQIGGKYKHYKGGLYKVISMATHSETQEAMVVYKSILFGSVHVRPLSMWFDDVTLSADNERHETVKRFELVVS